MVLRLSKSEVLFWLVFSRSCIQAATAGGLSLAQLGHYADFRGFALKPSNLEDWMVDEEPPGAVMSILC